jgi:hypothetical protein
MAENWRPTNTSGWVLMQASLPPVSPVRWERSTHGLHGMSDGPALIGHT